LIAGLRTPEIHSKVRAGLILGNDGKNLDDAGAEDDILGGAFGDDDDDEEEEEAAIHLMSLCYTTQIDSATALTRNVAFHKALLLQ
jgi:hypothetical protein